jgi:hypothetical protein
MKKLFSKLLIIVAFIACIAAIAAPNEAKAADNPFLAPKIEGCFYHPPPFGSADEAKCGYLRGKHVGFGLYIGEVFNNKDESLGTGFWFKKFMPDPEPEDDVKPPSPFEFVLLPGDFLQVMASTDAQCDVYELQVESRLILEDFTVIGNNSYQTIPISPSNLPYLIIFKVDGKVVSQQHFIFNSPNDLFIGGSND